MQEVEKQDDPKIPKPEAPDSVSGGLTPLMDDILPDPFPYPIDFPRNPNGPYDPLGDRRVVNP